MLEEEARKELKSKDKAASAVMDVPAPVAEKKKLSFKEKHEYETLEKDIAELETEKAELESKLSDASHSHDEIMKMALRFEEVKTQLDEKGLRWLELGEIVA
jgi:ATP-binding cassette subfamily F protein uup